MAAAPAAAGEGALDRALGAFLDALEGPRPSTRRILSKRAALAAAARAAPTPGGACAALGGGGVRRLVQGLAAAVAPERAYDYLRVGLLLSNTPARCQLGRRETHARGAALPGAARPARAKKPRATGGAAPSEIERTSQAMALAVLVELARLEMQFEEGGGLLDRCAADEAAVAAATRLVVAGGAAGASDLRRRAASYIQMVCGHPGAIEAPVRVQGFPQAVAASVAAAHGRKGSAASPMWLRLLACMCHVDAAAADTAAATPGSLPAVVAALNSEGDVVRQWAAHAAATAAPPAFDPAVATLPRSCPSYERHAAAFGQAPNPGRPTGRRGGFPRRVFPSAACGCRPHTPAAHTSSAASTPQLTSREMALAALLRRRAARNGRAR
ncbi:MAG: hypothetical protein J3K34DRAFT_461261 [Monoraphidium minutum]|nr:MAG: hypothetical protein J3K34DRAFT_461261 [Monoraphidium minutum]